MDPAGDTRVVLHSLKPELGNALLAIAPLCPRAAPLEIISRVVHDELPFVEELLALGEVLLLEAPNLVLEPPFQIKVLALQVQELLNRLLHRRVHGKKSVSEFIVALLFDDLDRRQGDPHFVYYFLTLTFSISRRC